MAAPQRAPDPAPPLPPELARFVRALARVLEEEDYRAAQEKAAGQEKAPWP